MSIMSWLWINLPHVPYRKGDTEKFYSESVPPNTSPTL